MIEIVPNWHPVLVHFTIALLTIAVLLFFIAVFAGRNRSAHAIETTANWNLWLGAALTVVTVVAGFQAAATVTHDDAAHLAMEDHKFWALGTATLFVVLALWNGLRVRRGQKWAWPSRWSWSLPWPDSQAPDCAALTSSIGTVSALWPCHRSLMKGTTTNQARSTRMLKPIRLTEVMRPLSRRRRRR